MGYNDIELPAKPDPEWRKSMNDALDYKWKHRHDKKAVSKAVTDKYGWNSKGEIVKEK